MFWFWLWLVAVALAAIGWWSYAIARREVALHKECADFWHAHVVALHDELWRLDEAAATESPHQEPT